MSIFLHMITQTLAAAVATVGFSLLFGTPARYYPFCGLIGGAGWLIYITTQPFSSAASATFLATVIIIFMSRWFAVRKHCPVTIFLISGLIPLVPGNGLYWATYYGVTGNLAMAFQTGLEAFKVAVAIVLGIVFVLEVPQKVFHIGNRT